MKIMRRYSRFFEKIPVRLRLSLGHALTMGVVLLGIGIGVSRLIEQSVFESLDTTLLTSAKAIRDSGLSQDNKLKRLRNSAFWWSILDEFYDGRRLAIRSYAQMVDPSGNISAKTGNVGVRLPVTPRSVARAELGLPTFETFALEARGISRLRQVTLPQWHKGRFTGELIQVGAPMDSNYRMLARIQNMLLLSLSAALFVSILFGYLLTRSAFKPVAKISKAAAFIGIEDLNRRLPLPPATDELRTLTRTFNGMIGRLDDAFCRLRRFSGDVSHELRTPLAVLRGEAELALRKERSPSEYRRSLEMVALEAKHMSNIVEDLLLLARAQGKSLVLKRERIDFYGLINSLEDELSREILSKSVEFQVSCDSECQVWAAYSYIKIILKNLLMNAVKHSPLGGRVSIHLKSTIMQASISVKDEGEGISPKDVPYVFDTFFRADTARNRSLGGTGIGLSLSKALVDLHGGSLAVFSEAGEGAEFKVTLPMNSEVAGGEA